MKTDFEILIEMFDKAGIYYYVGTNNSAIYCGTGEGAEFYFNDKGELTGGC